MKICRSILRLQSRRFASSTKSLMDMGLGRKPSLLFAYMNAFDSTSRYYSDKKVLEDLIQQYRDIQASLSVPNLNADDAEFYEAEKTELQQAIKIETDRLELTIIQDQFKSVEDSVEGAIVEFRGGVGGDESHIFAEEMFNFYSGFLGSKGYSVQRKEVSASSKNMSFKVSSNAAYREIKCDSGVHKVIRVPETETKGRLHSSTISLVVLPDVPFEFNLNEKELKLEYCRSQGPGGQHVNKTESACRVTHLPTGTQVLIQDFREQHKNKMRAIEVLKERLYQLEFEKKREEEKRNRKMQMGSGDRSDKIRTFNFQQDRITDHRLNKTVYGIEKHLATGEFFDECIQQILNDEKEETLKDFYDSLEAKYLQ